MGRKTCCKTKPLQTLVALLTFYFDRDVLTPSSLRGMMLNEGMFSGSSGYVLKPNGYLGKTTSSIIPQISRESQADVIAHRNLTLSIEILAAQGIPLPLGDTRQSGFHPYVKCELHVEKPAERTGEPIEGGGKAKEGEYKWRSRTMKGTEVDFAAEKVEFKEIPGVVEELSFLRYLRFSSLRTSCFLWSYRLIELGIDNQRKAGMRRFRCEGLEQATSWLRLATTVTLLLRQDCLSSLIILFCLHRYTSCAPRRHPWDYKNNSQLIQRRYQKLSFQASEADFIDIQI